MRLFDRCVPRSAVLIVLAVLAGGIGVVSSSRAQVPAGDDWRQWGGPRRNFTADAIGLADTWPAAGPPLQWTRPLGLGHSAIVSDAGRLYTMYRPGRQVSGKGP